MPGYKYSCLRRGENLIKFPNNSQKETKNMLFMYILKKFLNKNKMVNVYSKVQNGVELIHFKTYHAELMVYNCAKNAFKNACMLYIYLSKKFIQ